MYFSGGGGDQAASGRRGQDMVATLPARVAAHGTARSCILYLYFTFVLMLWILAQDMAVQFALRCRIFLCFPTFLNYDAHNRQLQQV